MKSKIIKWLMVVLWLAVIFGLSSMGSFKFVTGTEKRSDLASTIVHMILYAVLGFLMAQALSPGIKIKKAILFAILISATYGFTDEWHQSYVPGREASIVDWGFDVFGSVIGAVFFWKKRAAT